MRLAYRCGLRVLPSAKGRASFIAIRVAYRPRHAQLALSQSSGYTGLDLTLNGLESNANFSIFTGQGDTSIAGQGVIGFKRGVLKFDSNFDGNWQNAAIEYQPRRDGLSPVVGFGQAASGGVARFGPVVGLAHPIGKALDFNVELRPQRKAAPCACR